MIIRNDRLKLYEKSRKNLSMGITCTGDLHIGFMLTACNAFNYLNENKSASLDIVVHDLFGVQIPYKRVLHPFKYAPDKHSCHEFAREHTLWEVSDYVSEMMQASDRVRFHYMSDILSDDAFRENLAGYVSENEADLRTLYGIQGTKEMPIKPICPDCNRSQGKWATYEEGWLHAECDGYEYSVELKDPTVEIEPDIALSSLRDVLDNNVVPHSDVHFQGGDKIRKPVMDIGVNPLQLTKNVIELSGHTPPDFFIGAQVRYKRKSLSKSVTSFFKYSQLKELPNWQDRMYDFAAMTEGKGVVELTDYSLFKEIL
ncbi:MAG: hypothetical protein ACQESG_07805 [Nanobdellota archaeon]